VKISDVKIGDRVRSAPGWLDDLERSIEKLGVLQPIGVTPDSELIFGYRRLMACKALGMEEIPARVIDVAADDPVTALRMEQAENNIRKDFTPSEKVEIARRIEEALAGRHGSNQHKRKEECQKIDTPPGRSDDIAAKSVGWNRETYRQAKKVVEEAPPEVKAKVDAGEMSVSAAYKETRPKKKTFRITLKDRADATIKELGEEEATELARLILKACGHGVEIEED